MPEVLQIDNVIFWVRSDGPDGKDRVPMYFKGRWPQDCKDGWKGDIKARPVELGAGNFTATYSPHDFEWENGNPIFQNP